MMRKSSIFAGWLVLGLGWLAVAPAAAQLNQNELFANVAFDPKLGQEIPLDLQLRDETGQTVRLGQYFGQRPVLLTLVYYDCPMLCTLVLNGLVKSLKVLKFEPGVDFEIVTVSFRAGDTPAQAAAKKKVYLQEYQRPGAAEGWHFLTGDEASIRTLTESVGFRFILDPQSQEYAHPSGLYLLTPAGRISRAVPGKEYPPKDLRLALIEASEGKIGTLADHFVLLCYAYDPITGRYGLAILNLLRIACVVTLAALGTYVLVMLHRDRHRLRT